MIGFSHRVFTIDCRRKCNHEENNPEEKKDVKDFALCANTPN